jgi:hypothetical protein
MEMELADLRALEAGTAVVLVATVTAAMYTPSSTMETAVRTVGM